METNPTRLQANLFFAETDTGRTGRLNSLGSVLDWLRQSVGDFVDKSATVRHCVLGWQWKIELNGDDIRITRINGDPTL